ncbi:aminotransferase class I/II-fold pyridoxal phosphate-dependent enzyme [Xylocopilactobacillus apicola]|uniref:Aminotransferase n=1 Tax=Xylocopilactobacillus apicola TaxID=2932184 RepID=A0AAU9DDC4_9LACO|nr:aminotransferase class I/II-fold pyridoxal phosphate-dependent enzyme [Xylocopilactobacillus apicola]BDR57810.1 aminotransferase [Xylocopilactobacillus apicola]
MTNSLLGKMNKRLADIKPSDIRAFDEKVSTVPGMLKLTLGEPDFHTPEHVKAAGIKAIENNETQYAPSNGTQGLKEAAADFIDRHYNLHYSADETIITVGATESLYTVFASILNEGDEVLVPTPTFPLYFADISVNGGIPVFINTASNGFVLTPEMLDEAFKAHSNVKAIMLNYPSNPTGVTYSRDEVKALADYLADKDIFVVADEIYSEITYDQRHTSIAEFLPEKTILINGASKSHAMTGWRIGTINAPLEITRELGKIHQFTVTAAGTMNMAAAEEAFKNGYDDGTEMKKEYQKRRDYLVDSLSELGFTCAKPTGAFYLFVRIPAEMQQDSFKFCYDLADRVKLALIAGAAFGPGGEGYVRLSYAASMADLKEAVKRLAEYKKMILG